MFFFFFQAEDGIRDIGVTGVQTCALPICVARRRTKSVPMSGDAAGMSACATSYHPYPSFFFLLRLGLGARGYVFVRGPVAQVDDAAAFAAKGEIGVVRDDRFLANWASHHTATRGEILMNAEAARGGAGSVGASRGPTTS